MSRAVFLNLGSVTSLRDSVKALRNTLQFCYNLLSVQLNFISFFFRIRMSSKKRKWSEDYVRYGFTYTTEQDGTQHPQCMLCFVKLSNISLVPAKLREHFIKLHGEGQYKDATLDEFKFQRARFDARATLPAHNFIPIDKPILSASYEVAYLIAKQGKPHTVGETLIKPPH